MKSFFSELFEYNHHINQKLGDFLIDAQDRLPEKVIQLYSHVLNAHQIWNNRIEPGQPAFGVWESQPVPQYNVIDQTNYERSLLILDKFDLNDTIHYTNTKGHTFHNSVRDIFFHIINHSTYHKGQIAAALRKAGIEPLATDYIFYKR